MAPITAEQKSSLAEISEKISASKKVTSFGPKKSEVKSTNDKKNSKEKMVSITTEEKSSPAKVSERTSVPQNISKDGQKESGVKSTIDKKTSKVPQKATPEVPMKSGLKFTKSKKKPRGKKGTGIQTPDNPDKKTPYQGLNKACGLFRCLDCKKGWFSPHTWANTYQKCKGCDAEIYPHVQFKPRKGKGPKKNIPHPSELCQKCMMLGFPCNMKATNRQREE